ncbi:WD40-repeat-containing domain protein [Chytridium lagenaria]|nr:WD40-repeat-containing domain protein [Chytridium lagenaria]
MGLIGPTERKERQYLAIGGYKNRLTERHIMGMRQQGDELSMRNCIQIWSFTANSKTSDNGPLTSPKLEVVILHNFGCVYDLKWSPEAESHPEKGSQATGTFSRIGLLAATFGDGSVRVFNIPNPGEVRRRFNLPVYATLHMRFTTTAVTAYAPDGLLWRVAWMRSNRIAVGSTSGTISILGLESRPIYQLTRPMVVFPAHDTSVADIHWKESSLFPDIKGYGGAGLLTVGPDGRVMFHDIQDVWFGHEVYRIRGFITCLAWSSFVNCIGFVDADCAIRIAVPGVADPKAPKVTEGEDSTYKLPRTTPITSHLSTPWSADCSHYAPFLVSGGADGAVLVANMNRLWARIAKPYKVNLYQLNKPADGELEMVDNIGKKLLSQVRTKGEHPVSFFPAEVAIQRVAFNKNFRFHSWVASAGAMGIVRIENTLTRS